MERGWLLAAMRLRRSSPLSPEAYEVGATGLVAAAANISGPTRIGVWFSAGVTAERRRENKPLVLCRMWGKSRLSAERPGHELSSAPSCASAGGPGPGLARLLQTEVQPFLFHTERDARRSRMFHWPSCGGLPMECCNRDTASGFADLISLSSCGLPYHTRGTTYLADRFCGLHQRPNGFRPLLPAGGQ
jgi:hypothetical protein